VNHNAEGVNLVGGVSWRKGEVGRHRDARTLGGYGRNGARRGMSLVEVEPAWLNVMTLEDDRGVKNWGVCSV